MTRTTVIGALCLVIGVTGTGVVLFTEMTYWLLSVGGPYFGMAVGTFWVAVAFVGYAMVLPWFHRRWQRESGSEELAGR